MGRFNFSKMKAAFSVAVLLTVALIVMLFWTSRQSLHFIRTLEKVHFPAIEVSLNTIKVEEKIFGELSRELFLGEISKELDHLLPSFKELTAQLFEFSSDYDHWGLEIAEQSYIRNKSFNDYIFLLEEIRSTLREGELLEAQEMLSSVEFVDLRAQVQEQMEKEVQYIFGLKNRVVSEYNNNLKYFWWELLISFLFLGSTWFFMIRAYNRSLNEKKEAEERYEKQRILSAQNMKLVAIGEMAGNIAHEINNPLAVIRGYSQQLIRLRKSDKVIDPQKTEEMLERIIRTTDRISNIVKSLLKLSRKSVNSEKIWQSLDAIVEDSVNLCGEKFTNLGIQLEVDLSNTDQYLINCHPIEISQVILNLLNNSADAIEGFDEPWIRVRSSVVKGDRLQLTITDSGKGIPELIREKIMTPYFSTKPEGKGTGLGLSISSSIIAESGGFLFYNDRAKNTEFVIEFPAVEEGVRKASAVTSAKAKNSKETAA